MSGTLETRAFNQLEGIRAVKKAQIEKFLDDRHNDMKVLAETVSVLEREGRAKLSAVRQIKKSAVESYFETIRSQVITLSQNRMIVDATRRFRSHFHNYVDERALSPEQLESMKRRLRTYYDNEYLPEYQNQNGSEGPSVDEIFAKMDSTAIALQYEYIRANKHPLGNKHQLDEASDGHPVQHRARANPPPGP